MDTWDLMSNWELVLPPSRPSGEEIARIRVFASNLNRTNPVCVLGSTPEFVDLLHELGFKYIYVFDRNIQFYLNTKKQRVFSSHREEFIHGDWLDTLGTFKGYFQLILSDLTSGNVPYDHQGAFYELIALSLSKDGTFIDKVLTHKKRKLILSELIDKYSKLPYNLLYINYFSCEVLFCSELLNLKDLVDTSLFYKILEEKAVSNNRLQAFIKGAQIITPRDFIWHYGVTWSVLSRTYQNHFNIISKFGDKRGSPYYPGLRIFISKSKH